MTDDTLLPFALPSVQGKKVTAAFDGGRISSDGGVMLLALAERRIGIADKLAAEIADRRDPARVTHLLADMLRDPHPRDRLRRTRMATTSITCAAIPRSNWPAATCRIAEATCARSRPSRAPKTRPACAR